MTLKDLMSEMISVGMNCEFDQYGNLKGEGHKISFLFGDDNGCGVVNKPNGTVKWYYNKSCKQFARIVKSVIECNQFAQIMESLN